ncbi:MAG: hypothetical protein LAT50_21985 [Ectothiorhodospiraceae bacterium]|nr:hypothetical protein [Ectothiorhodospiraceae bacterium]
MVPRLLCLLLLVTMPLAALAVDDDDGDLVQRVEPRVVPEDVRARWGIGIAYGPQWYGEGNESGMGGAVQLTYSALLDTDTEGRWLFELGIERSLSYDDPEVEEGRTARLQSTGAFYRFSRYIGRRFYLGGRVGMARVRGTDDKRNLDLVVGLQTGVQITNWLDIGVEALASEPTFRARAGYPAEVRGVVTFRY